MYFAVALSISCCNSSSNISAQRSKKMESRGVLVSRCFISWDTSFGKLSIPSLSFSLSESQQSLYNSLQINSAATLAACSKVENDQAEIGL
jgi:hypothetical protein